MVASSRSDRSRCTAPATTRTPSQHPDWPRFSPTNPTVADLGYVGVDGIDIVPYKRSPRVDLNDSQIEFNTSLSKIRSAVEQAIAHLKTWRMLSEEGGRYRAPLEKYPSMIKAVVGLFFLATYE